jgi:hypothetical protein
MDSSQVNLFFFFCKTQAVIGAKGRFGLFSLRPLIYNLGCARSRILEFCRCVVFLWIF